MRDCVGFSQIWSHMIVCHVAKESQCVWACNSKCVFYRNKENAIFHAFVPQ